MTNKLLKMTIAAIVSAPLFASAKIQTVYSCQVLNDRNISNLYIYLTRSTNTEEGFIVTLQDKYGERENVSYTFAARMADHLKHEFRKQEIAELNAQDDKTTLVKLLPAERPTYNVAFNYERSNKDERTKGRLYKKELKIAVDKHIVANMACRVTKTLPVISKEENQASNVAYQSKNSKVKINATVTTRESGCEREEMEGTVDLTHVALDPVYEERGLFSKDFTLVDQSEHQRTYNVRCDIAGEKYVPDEQ